MKDIMLGCSLVLLISAHAQAQDFAASMKVIQTKDNFQKVTQVNLRLTNKNSMSINLEYDDGDSNFDLKIFDIQQDQKGCTTYRAKLDRSEEEERVNGFWFFVDLIDYSSCESNVEKWQAFVRSGCRCCGIEDSTMTLSGNPQEV